LFRGRHLVWARQSNHRYSFSRGVIVHFRKGYDMDESWLREILIELVEEVVFRVDVIRDELDEEEYKVIEEVICPFIKEIRDAL